MLHRRQTPGSKGLTCLLMTMAAVILLTSCGDRSTTPVPRKVLRLTFTQEPDNLNPLYTSMWFSVVTREFWLRTTLIAWDDKPEPMPEVAAEIPSRDNGGVSADGLTLTYKLRHDLTWSDGAPLTAVDYVFTYQMLMSEQNTVQTRDPYDKYVASVEAPDPYTLVIHLRRPFAAWRTRIFGSSNGGAIPRHILEPVFRRDGTLDRADWNRRPTVGHGPFRFQEWETGSHLLFVADASYWRHAPKIEQILVRIVPDDTAQVATLKTGNTDMGVFISWADVPDLQKLGTLNLVQVSSGFQESLFFNLSLERGHPALQDQRVRRALVMAIDRHRLIQDLLFGLTKPALTFWDHSPFADPTITPIPYDPAEAARLLDEAGWRRGPDGWRAKDGKTLRLRYATTTRDIRKHTQVVVQQMLERLGVAVDLYNHASDVFFSGYGDGGPAARGQYDLAQWTTAPDGFPDPDTAQWLCAEIPSDQNPAGGNWSYLCDPTLDQLFQQQASTVDPQTRREVFRQITRIIAEQVYWVSLWDDADVYAVHKRVKNVRLSGVMPFWHCNAWDVTPASQSTP
jgi:peptide/nickel transport system substrate-binding protein